jgi:5'-3' exonuclease
MEKQEFREKAKQSIDEIFDKIEELKAKKDEAKAELVGKYEEQIAELEAKRDELQSKYDQLIDAAEDKWEDVKGAFTESAASFKEGFSKLLSPFKKDNDDEEPPVALCKNLNRGIIWCPYYFLSGKTGRTINAKLLVLIYCNNIILTQIESFHIFRNRFYDAFPEATFRGHVVHFRVLQ